MSEPALSEVPVQRTGPVAGRAPPGTAAGPLCPCGVHAPRPAGAAGLAEQERDLRTVVSGQRRDAVDSGSRRETPRGGHRLLQRAPYLESETTAPSACPLRGAGRRIIA